MRYDTLVNKLHLYNENDFVGRELVKTADVLGDSVLIEKNTFINYLKFKKHLRTLGIRVNLSSAYRSFEEQRELIKESLVKYGEDYVASFVAPAGASEHHTGLAIDITIYSKKEWQQGKNENLDEKKIEKANEKYLVMKDICSMYGFILRYPMDKEEITGYRYEPWHFRYVGIEMAQEIMNKNIVLEEYSKGI